MKITFTLLFTFFLTLGTIAQEQLTQTVRGSVSSTDPDSEIFNASIIVVGSSPLIGTVTDINNEFSLKVPTGRQVIEVRCMGFETKQFDVSLLRAKSLLMLFCTFFCSIERR